MKKTFMTLILLFSGILLFAESYSLTSLNFKLSKEINDIFSIGITLNTKKNSEVISMYLGTVVDVNDDPKNETNLGCYVEVESNFEYF